MNSVKIWSKKTAYPAPTPRITTAGYDTVCNRPMQGQAEIADPGAVGTPTAGIPFND